MSKEDYNTGYRNTGDRNTGNYNTGDRNTGGYLKVNGTTRNEKKVSIEHREFLESLPNFDPKILKETSGIDLEEKSCNNKIVEIDGKKYKLTEVE
jgi:hypothetical protein